ncbi:unnamed protein product [Diamesa serratosioi]
MQKLLVFLVFVGILKVTFGQAHTTEFAIKNFFREIGTYTLTNNIGQSYLKTYYVSRSLQLNWANAFSFCKANDMNLVELETEDEANNFLKMCADQKLEYWYHIGGSVEGSLNLWDYYWMTTGKKIPYSLYFMPGEPNGNGEERCLSIAFTSNLGQRQLKTYYGTRSLELSWANAFSFCKANDMDLVELETEDEANNFLKMCVEQNLEEYYHVGGSSEGISNFWDYYWMTTGAKVSYNLNYKPGELNGKGTERCLAIGKQPIKYAFCDVSCHSLALRFACQNVE